MKIKKFYSLFALTGVLFLTALKTEAACSTCPTTTCSSRTCKETECNNPSQCGATSTCDTHKNNSRYYVKVVYKKHYKKIKYYNCCGKKICVRKEYYCCPSRETM